MMGMQDDGCGSEHNWRPGCESWYGRHMLAMDMRRMHLREVGIHDDILGTSLSLLDLITVPELVLGKSHRGRVLYGIFCVEPVTDLCVNNLLTVLVDTKAHASSIRVITSKFLWAHSTAPTSLASSFCLGKQVAIKVPKLEMSSDGIYAVRVINPSPMICLESVNAGCNSSADFTDGTTDCTTDGTLLEELEKIRSEGNQSFGEENWAAACRCVLKMHQSRSR